MAGMNFCPYDGKAINKENLAYEIIHPYGWNWDRVKKETVLGQSIPKYISENDGKRARYAEHMGYSLVKADGDTDKKQVMLLANAGDSGKDGFALLKEKLEGKEENKPNASESILDQHFDSYEDFIKYAYGGRKRETSDAGDQEEFVVAGSKPSKLRYVYENNLHKFVNENEDTVMYALPCCPYCHNRIPVGWFEADDFIGVTVTASSETQSIDAIHEMISDGAGALRKKLLETVDSVSVVDVSVAEYPDQAEVEKSGKPQFLKITVNENDLLKTKILGLYGCSEDKIQNLNPIQNPELSNIMRRMTAEFAVNELEDNNAEEAAEAAFANSRLLTIEEQADYQRKNQGLVISARDILAINTKSFQ